MNSLSSRGLVDVRQWTASNAVKPQIDNPFSPSVPTAPPLPPRPPRVKSAKPLSSPPVRPARPPAPVGSLKIIPASQPKSKKIVPAPTTTVVKPNELAIQKQQDAFVKFKEAQNRYFGRRKILESQIQMTQDPSQQEAIRSVLNEARRRDREIYSRLAKTKQWQDGIPDYDNMLAAADSLLIAQTPQTQAQAPTPASTQTTSLPVEVPEAPPAPAPEVVIPSEVVRKRPSAPAAVAKPDLLNSIRQGTKLKKVQPTSSMAQPKSSSQTYFPDALGAKFAKQRQYEQEEAENKDEWATGGDGSLSRSYSPRSSHRSSRHRSNGKLGKLDRHRHKRSSYSHRRHDESVSIYVQSVQPQSSDSMYRRAIRRGGGGRSRDKKSACLSAVSWYWYAPMSLLK